jgi:hypothetical protein
MAERRSIRFRSSEAEDKLDHIAVIDKNLETHFNELTKQIVLCIGKNYFDPGMQQSVTGDIINHIGYLHKYKQV